MRLKPVTYGRYRLDCMFTWTYHGTRKEWLTIFRERIIVYLWKTLVTRIQNFGVQQTDRRGAWNRLCLLRCVLIIHQIINWSTKKYHWFHNPTSVKQLYANYFDTTMPSVCFRSSLSNRLSVTEESGMLSSFKLNGKAIRTSEYYQLQNDLAILNKCMSRYL